MKPTDQQSLILDYDGKNYFIRHSFSYDFKLGKYIFDELLDIMERDFKSDRSKLEKSIQEIFLGLADGREREHFKPYDQMFFHKNELLTTNRTYFESKEIRYR